MEPKFSVLHVTALFTRIYGILWRLISYYLEITEGIQGVCVSSITVLEVSG